MHALQKLNTSVDSGDSWDVAADEGYIDVVSTVRWAPFL